jgi:hypothetical protein
VRAAGAGVTGEVEWRVTAVERLHAGEGEGVPDCQVAACRLRAARVAAASS